jgi:hypothetical protein
LSMLKRVVSQPRYPLTPLLIFASLPNLTADQTLANRQPKPPPPT